ncbi:MAG: RecBCD enzyme subunit RecD [Pseudomonadota bacterium]
MSLQLSTLPKFNVPQPAGTSSTSGTAVTWPWTPLDVAWLKFLNSHQASTNALHDLLALLVSYQMGRGHACLDLELLWQDPAHLLDWSDAQINALKQSASQSTPHASESPPDLFSESMNPWAEATQNMPWAMGEHSPMVLSQQREGLPRRIYLRRAWQAEQSIQAVIQARLATHFEVPQDTEEKLKALFGDEAQTTDWQRVACAKALRTGITLITGGPGTGKTTTVVRLLALLQRAAKDQQQTLRIHLAAPTGKAASRLSASIQSALASLPEGWAEGIPYQAVTLHQLLQYNPDAAARPAPILAIDLVVVDEASMIDLELMARLMACVPAHARLVLLGDKDQLASVEAGAVWSQLCEGAAQSDDRTHAHCHTAYTLPEQTAVLHVSRRFDAHSAIGQWAKLINEGQHEALKARWQTLPITGQLPVAESTDIQRWPEAWRDRSQGALHPEVVNALKLGWTHWLSDLKPLLQTGAVCDNLHALQLLNSFSEYQVLCALRQGAWGVQALNERIAGALGLSTNREMSYQASAAQDVWFVGRPVMVTRNDYHLNLMNGDVGQCLPTANGLRVAFPDGEGGVRWVLPSRLDAVETVWAMTVHKSQGSEYDQVLMVLPDRDAPVLTRELLYTGVTRAKSKLTWWAPNPAVLFSAVRQRVTRSGGLADGLFHPAK